MFCSKCAKENENTAKFCSACGNSLNKDFEKSAEQKAEDIKQKSKESASTLFYLIKPFLKVKAIVPVLVVLLTVLFWSNMVKAYDDYQYEKEKLAKEKKETFTDTSTGLMWQDSSHNIQKDWDSAISYCQNTEYAGFSDWRLPSKSELEDLYTKKDNLKNVASSYYWSSSVYVSYSSKAWIVYFDSGNTRSYYKSSKVYVRCVRGRQ